MKKSLLLNFVLLLFVLFGVSGCNDDPASKSGPEPLCRIDCASCNQQGYRCKQRRRSGKVVVGGRCDLDRLRRKYLCLWQPTWSPLPGTERIKWHDETGKVAYSAYYPGNATGDVFTLPSDQSAPALLSAADYMTTAYKSLAAKPENNILTLHFIRKNTKLIVRFRGIDGTTDNVRIRSPYCIREPAG